MKMIIAGNSPYVVSEAFKTCCEYTLIACNCNLEDCSSLYKTAIDCILGQSTNIAYSTVFRSGVDSPVSAITRLVKSLKEYAALDETSSSSGVSEQQVADFLTIIRRFESAVYESLRAAAKECKLSSALQSDLLNIVETVILIPLKEKKCILLTKLQKN